MAANQFLMADLLFTTLSVAFFALAFALARFCERLR